MKTTINGKEIKLFTNQDIATVLTSKVNEFLSKGFVFYIGEGSRGSQGEETKVCMTNDGGKTVYLIYIIKKYACMNPTMSIFVKRYHEANERRTFWLNEGEEVYMKTFFQITDYKKELYVENPVECKAIKDKQYKRRSHYYNVQDAKKETVLSENCKKIALKMLRQRKGYKSTQLKDIQKVVRRSGSICVYIAKKGYATIR